MGEERVSVAVGNRATSMMGPSKCALRELWSLTTLAMSTLKVPFRTVVPSIVMDPHTLLVRPTAVEFWPMRTSLTRYPATEPVPTFHTPETEDALAAAPAPVDVV